MKAALVMAACRSVVVSAVPLLAAPAATVISTATPAVALTVPAMMANLTEPSGQVLLTVACAVAPVMATPLPLGMSPWRTA